MSNLSIRVIFHTQFRENYGAHNWDGEGECPQSTGSQGWFHLYRLCDSGGDRRF